MTGYSFTFDLGFLDAPGTSSVLNYTECNSILRANGYKGLELICDERGRPKRWVTYNLEGRELDPKWAIADAIRARVFFLCTTPKVEWSERVEQKDLLDSSSGDA